MMEEMTPEQRRQRNEDIVRLYTAGMSLSQLATKYGCSSATVYKVIGKAGAHVSPEERDRRRRSFPRGPGIIWTPEMNRALIMARVNGKPLAKCAAEVGVSYTLAWKRLTEFGLASRDKAA